MCKFLMGVILQLLLFTEIRDIQLTFTTVREYEFVFPMHSSNTVLINGFSFQFQFRKGVIQTQHSIDRPNSFCSSNLNDCTEKCLMLKTWPQITHTHTFIQTPQYSYIECENRAVGKLAAFFFLIVVVLLLVTLNLFIEFANWLVLKHFERFFEPIWMTYRNTHRLFTGTRPNGQYNRNYTIFSFRSLVEMVQYERNVQNAIEMMIYSIL